MVGQSRPCMEGKPVFLFWRRKANAESLELLARLVDLQEDNGKKLDTINRKADRIMAKQDEFNTKVDALSAVVGGIGANQVQFGVVVDNFKVVIDNLKGQLADAQANNIDTSGFDAVYAQAVTVKENGDKILNPAVVTPPVDQIPTVPPIEPTPGEGENAGQSPETPAPVETIPDVPATDPEVEAPVTVETPATDAPATETPAADSDAAAGTTDTTDSGTVSGDTTTS